VTAASINDDRSADSRNLKRVRAIEAELSALGMTTHLTDGRAGLDLTATLSPSRQREPEFWIDEDGYAELRYYNPPRATPSEVAATVQRVLDMISALAHPA
jgi:hypothetical protein